MRFPEITRLARKDGRVRWTARDARLYALAIGYGATADELRFVTGTAPIAVPTLVTLAMYQTGVGPLGIDVGGMLHSEQEVEFLGPVPAAADLLGDSRVVSVHDRGVARGALIRLEIALRSAADDTPVARLTTTIVARGDGGFGGAWGELPPRPALPERAPECSVRLPTRPDQALLYSLLGDPNPIHLDPAAARAAGFDQPIAHGLCTLGMSCRAVIDRFLGGDPSRLRAHRARFSGPFHPGETLQLDFWRDDALIRFVARAAERDAIVLGYGASVIG